MNEPKIIRDHRVDELLRKVNAELSSAREVLGNLSAMPGVQATSRGPIVGLPIFPGPEKSDDTTLLAWTEKVLKLAVADLSQASSKPRSAVEELIDKSAAQVRKALDECTRMLQGFARDRTPERIHKICQALVEAERHADEARHKIAAAKPKAVAIASDLTNSLNVVPLSFCVLSVDPGPLFKKELERLNAAFAAPKSAAASKPPPPARELKRPEWAVQKEKELRAAAARAGGSQGQQEETAWEDRARLEEECEREEEAEEQRRKELEKEARKRGLEPQEGIASFWERKGLSQHLPKPDAYLAGVGVEPLKNAHLLLVDSPDPTSPRAHVREAYTDDAGTPFWAETKKPALLEAAKTYWCFWTYDKKRLPTLSDLHRAMQGGRSLAQGFFSFRVEASSLDPASASTLFPIGELLKQAPGGDAQTVKVRQEQQRYALAALVHNTKDGQGYVEGNDVAMADVKQRGGGFSPGRGWVFARRPAVAAVYLTEFLKYFSIWMKADAAWALNTMAMMEGIVDTSRASAANGDRLPELDFSAMRALGELRSESSETYTETESTLLARRWQLRVLYPELVRYARRCAMAGTTEAPPAGPQDPSRVHVSPIPKHCTAEEFELALGKAGHSWAERVAAQERISATYGVHFPRDAASTLMPAGYEQAIKDHFAFYQYHRLVDAPTSVRYRSGWLAQHRHARGKVEEAAAELAQAALERLVKEATFAKMVADVAWHEKPSAGGGQQERHGDRESYIFLRYFSLAGDVGYAWWMDLPEEGSALGEAAIADLSERAKEAFETLDSANTLITRAMLLKEKEFVAALTKSTAVFKESCERMGVLERVLQGGGMQVRDKYYLRPAITKQGASLEFTRGLSDEVLATVKLNIQRDLNPRATRDTYKFRDRRIDVDEFAKAHGVEVTKVPRTCASLIQLALLGMAIKEFADSNRSAEAVFQLAGSVGCTIGALAEAVEVARIHRLHAFVDVGAGVGEKTLAILTPIQIFQTFREGVLCAFDEGSVAASSGDVRRAYFLRAKGFVLIAGAGAATAITVSEILAAGLSAAAFGPAGWILAAAALTGLLMDGLCSLFGESRTFLTEKEDNLSRAIEFEFGSRFCSEGRLEYEVCRTLQHLRRVTEAVRFMLSGEAYLVEVAA